jgi:CPA2 family monovalent cation:H+ antiporter-2
VLGALVSLFWGWGLGASIVFGLCLSVASTVVLLRALETRGLIKTTEGQIAIGWLIVEDLVMVMVLVLLPPLAGLLLAADQSVDAVPAKVSSLWLTVGITLAKVTAFIVLMLVVGRRALPKILWLVAKTGSRELFTLAVISIAMGVAFGAAMLFDVSFALGAFFAGMMMRESEFSHRAADESLPLRDAFAVLFFVSVGMLFDPAVIWTQPGKLLVITFIILVGKTVAAVLLVLLFRYTLNSALIVGASLAQIGEFSFILVGLGIALGLLPTEAQSLVLAAALVTIAINPLMFTAIEPGKRWLVARWPMLEKFQHVPVDHLEMAAQAQTDALVGQVVLIGYGRVGKRIGQVLKDRSIPFIVIEQNRELVEFFREQGVNVVQGDALVPDVLLKANLKNASMLVVAVPDAINVRQMVQHAREINPGLKVVLRTHNEEEADLLHQEGLGDVFLGENELARGMSHHIVTLYDQGKGG